MFQLSLVTVFLSGFLPATMSAHAAQPVRGPGLRLDAQEIRAGTRRQVVVAVSDSSRHAGAITVHVYFVGKAPNAGARFIYASSELSIMLKGAPAVRAEVDVPALKSEPRKRSPPKGFAYLGVGDAEGWIISAEINGHVLQTRASIPCFSMSLRGDLMTPSKQ